MGYFDLNIPYLESDRHVTDKSGQNMRRLKLTLKAMELGYTGVAYNRTLKGVMSDSHRCCTPLYPIPKLTPNISSSSAYLAAVEFHRNLLNVPVSSPFRQYTRLTVVVDNPSQASALNSGNPILRSYDIVAARPMNQNAFDQACQTSEVDIISIDFAEKLPFRLKQPMVKAAVKRGVYFEITYSGLIADAQSRRQIISNCKLLVDWTRGKNIIFSSAATSVTELRGPQDVANLASLLGLPMERAKAAISKNCRSLLANALRKKHFYKEAVKVEVMPSGSQINAEKYSSEEWLKWDPISSGDGDLLLDDLKKAFSSSSTIKKPVKAIDFSSAINGLPAHGLQIKDILPLAKAATEPPDLGNATSVDTHSKESVTVRETLKGPDNMPENLETIPENLGGNAAATNKSAQIFIPGVQSPSQGISDFYEVSISRELSISPDSADKGLVPEVLLTESNQTTLNNTMSIIEACGSKSLSTYDPPHAGTSINSGEAIAISTENMQHVLDVNVAAETQLQDTQSQRIEEHVLPDGQAFVATAKDEGNTVSNMGMCIEEGVVVDEVANKIDSNNEGGPLLALSDETTQPVYVEDEQHHKEAISGSAAFEGLPSTESLNIKPKFKERNSEDVMADCSQNGSVTSYQVHVESPEGRKRRKQSQPRQPFLFPFKHFLNHKPLKKKPRK